MLRAFDDWKSYVHLLAGAVSAALFPLWLFAVVYVAYLFYESLTSRTEEELKGDFAEFTIGAAAGLILRLIFPGLPPIKVELKVLSLAA